MVTEPAPPTGFTVWLTGLSGVGKTTIAEGLAERLRDRGLRVEVLDGDVVRTNLSQGLTFSKDDRDTNIRRIGWVCELLTRNGIVAVAAAISPYRAVREEVRARIGRFVEVHVDAPIEVLEARDGKGLYARAREGSLTGLTGVDDPYEPPTDPDVTVVSDGGELPEQSVERIIARLEELGYIEPVAVGAYTADEETEVTDRLRDLGYL